MSNPQLREQADQRFQQALEKTGARDPREFYRKRLRNLKAQNPEAFRRAVEYHDTRLVPSVAAEGSDPLREWLEYGRFLATLVAPGRTVQIDDSGRAREYAPPGPADHLVLHLPTDTRQPAMAVGIPSKLSPAQRATYALLVEGKQG
jgi:hypothetical protein